LETIEVVPGKVTDCTVFSEGNWVEKKRDGEVIAQANIAKKLLPTASGFFFGSTEYNEYYIDDLKHTIKMIEPYLNDDGGAFYYRSSW
jgi:hypothetical protein